ncbi:MAG: heme o synthase [Patescibacteria group bacterium]
MERHSRSYVQLMKPGITISNTLSGVAGFFLAASFNAFSITAFIGAIGGIAFVIASACVMNNVLDRDIDKNMKRTAKRDVATGVISIQKALLFGAVLGLVGFSLLIIWTNTITFLLGVLAYIWYIAIYGIAKRTTAYSTLVGGVAGALPPVAGYTALTGDIDAGAIILFLILFIWQMPHFYAIAMFRRDDYASAKLPIWSVRYGMKSTKHQIFAFTVLFGLVSILLTVFGYTGIVYLVGMLGLSGYWLYKGISLYNKVDDVKWARTMFGVSLLVLLSTLLLISIGGFLP